MKYYVASCAVCIALGIGIGYLISPGPDASGNDGVVGGHNERGEMRAAQRMHDQQDIPSMVTNDKSQGADAKGEQLVTVPTNLIRKISATPPVQSTRDSLFRKDDEVEKLLKITAHEKQALEEAWDVSRKKVEDLEVKTAKTKYLKDGSVSIEVPDLSQSLEPVGEAFDEAVVASLGQQRADLFLAMKHIDKVFTPNCGVRKNLITMESVGNGKWRYHITYQDNNSRHVWVGDSIPNRIRALTDAARIEPHMPDMARQR